MIKTTKASTPNVEMTDAQREAICYKSKLLNKYFDSYDEMKVAEDEYNKAHAKELAIKAERSADLAKVQNAANDYFAVVKKNQEARKAQREEEQKAYDVYREQLDEFSDKHNGYHLTYYKNGDTVEFKIEENHQDEIEKYLEEQQRRFKALFEDFWF